MRVGKGQKVLLIKGQTTALELSELINEQEKNGWFIDKVSAVKTPPSMGLGDTDALSLVFVWKKSEPSA